MKRPDRKMPTHAAIARYWAEREQINHELAPWSKPWGWDWCEPSCMACGTPMMDIDYASPTFGTWNRTGGWLQRCHVIPRFLNGLDLEPNLVLMCEPCHSAQPETADAEDTWAFMRERTTLDRLIGAGYLTISDGQIAPTSWGARVLQSDGAA